MTTEYQRPDLQKYSFNKVNVGRWKHWIDSGLVRLCRKQQRKVTGSGANLREKQQQRWHGFSGSKGIGLMVVCDNGGGSVVTVGWLIILPRGVGWDIMGYKPKRLPSYIELRKFSYSIILS